MARNPSKPVSQARSGNLKRAAAAPEAAPRDYLAGKLLIAMPNMTDPRFEKSLVLVVSHDAAHAMGVVVNKPLAELELGDLLEQLEIDPREGAGGEVVFYGGPVQTDRGLVIHTLDYRTHQTIDVTVDLGVTATKEILVDIGGRVRKLRPPKKRMLAVGHAGWGPGQLEAEIALNAWCHCEADPALVFAGEPGDAWNVALKKLGVTGAMLSPEWSRIRRDDALLN